MLLRRGSSSRDDAGDVDDGNEGKPRVAIYDRNKIMRQAILRESDNTTGGGNFIAAQITAAGVSKRSAVRRGHAARDASRTVVVGRRAGGNYGGQRGRRAVVAGNHRHQVEYQHFRTAISDEHEISIARDLQSVRT